jgi:hypothetical protein
MITSELKTRRSAIAVATVVESNTFPQSAKGRLVVRMVDRCRCLWLITWKKRF